MEKELINTPQKEEKQKTQIDNTNENSLKSPTNNDIVNGLLNKSINIKDIDRAYQDGEMSEEDYNDILTKYEEAITPQQNNQDQLDLSTLSDIELQELLKNGEIDQETYDSVIENRDLNQQPIEEPVPVEGKYNSVKLFEKFMALKKYINIHLECYDDIEIDELTKMQLITISKIIKDIKQLKENLTFYMDNNFTLEDYKKNIYTYLLFNKSFAESLKKFRNILHLNPDKIIKEKEDNNKK